ncbi:MAG: dephospho-CoA kinase [Hyphomicrobiales bacterium]|nr:dephospho-CoA kinase [Hyphomicrobiales bacterium]
MIIIGLTGSIGMGKSTASEFFRRCGVPVHDADGVVHRLMARGGAAVATVEAAFPGVVRDGAVDRTALGQRVFGDDAALRRLEGILHPMVGRARDRMLRLAARHHHPAVVLDVPLLYETGGQSNCDMVVVVSAPAAVQAERVLRRPGMTRARLDEILKLQVSDAEKRHRADFIVQTGLGKGYSFRVVRRIVQSLHGRRGRHWPPPGRWPRYGHRPWHANKRLNGNA